MDKKKTRKSKGYVYDEIASDRGGLLLKIAYEIFEGNADGIENPIEISTGDGNVQFFKASHIEQNGLSRIVKEFRKFDKKLASLPNDLSMARFIVLPNKKRV